ncbi:MAG: hypothetical protein NZT92_11210 [Abditibacteriales bacterium]|nr:hypothetical protein [Abditibacteriales bacterium]MDW8366512.1 hypothetical protein [Abditibacteriales bacterium]
MTKIWFVTAWAAVGGLAVVMLHLQPATRHPQLGKRKDTAVKTEIATFGGG